MIIKINSINQYFDHKNVAPKIAVEDRKITRNKTNLLHGDYACDKLAIKISMNKFFLGFLLPFRVVNKNLLCAKCIGI